jgi:translation initiation factor eIF-2B subunit epsilon
MRRGNRYFGTDVVLARSSQVGESCLIGAGTVIGERTVIRRSILGRNCVIGADVTLDGAYLWDGVTVADGSRVSHSLIADGCCIAEGTVVSPGCMVAAHVSLGGPGVVLGRGLRVAKVGEHPRSPADSLSIGGGPRAGAAGGEGVVARDEPPRRDHQAVDGSSGGRHPAPPPGQLW